MPVLRAKPSLTRVVFHGPFPDRIVAHPPYRLSGGCQCHRAVIVVRCGLRPLAERRQRWRCGVGTECRVGSCSAGGAAGRGSRATVSAISRACGAGCAGHAGHSECGARGGRGGADVGHRTNGGAERHRRWWPTAERAGQLDRCQRTDTKCRWQRSDSGQYPPDDATGNPELAVVQRRRTHHADL
jgi:hypothetical protein